MDSSTNSATQNSARDATGPNAGGTNPPGESGSHLSDAQVRSANADKGVSADTQRIPVNVYEASDALVVVAPLPGVMPEDVELLVTPGHLRIDARLRSGAGKDYLVEEWTYGPYSRIVDIPPQWGAEGQATLANGQLAVRLLRGEPSGEGALITTRPGGDADVSR